MAIITDISTAPNIDAPVEPLSWSAPEPKLWVANQQGEYAGMVEYLDGHFLATGARGEDFGEYSDRGQAQDAVRHGGSGRRMPVGLLSNVAIVSAVVAISLAGMSLSVLIS